MMLWWSFPEKHVEGGGRVVIPGWYTTGDLGSPCMSPGHSQCVGCCGSGKEGR